MGRLENLEMFGFASFYLKKLFFLFNQTQVAINMDIESPQPSDITEAINIKEKELRFDLNNPFVMKAFIYTLFMTI